MGQIFEGNNNEFQEKYEIIDPQFSYTRRAERIIESTHREPGKAFQYEYLHNSLAKNLKTILEYKKSPLEIERRLEDLLSSESIDRMNQQYFMVDEYESFNIPTYRKKERRRGKRKPAVTIFDPRKGIDYDKIGAQLVENYMRGSYKKVFPTQESLHEFIDTYKDESYETLLYAVYNLAEEDDDDEDEDDMFSTMSKVEKIEDIQWWSSYVIGAILLRKSKSAEHMAQAMQIIGNIDRKLGDQFDKWKYRRVMDEFVEGADEKREVVMWTLLCDVAKQCKEEIYETCVALDDNIQHRDDLVLIELLEPIVRYIGTDNPVDKEVAFDDFREKYRSLVTALSDSASGETDQDENKDIID